MLSHVRGRAVVLLVVAGLTGACASEAPRPAVRASQPPATSSAPPAVPPSTSPYADPTTPPPGPPLPEPIPIPADSYAPEPVVEIGIHGDPGHRDEAPPLPGRDPAQHRPGPQPLDRLGPAGRDGQHGRRRPPQHRDRAVPPDRRPGARRPGDLHRPGRPFDLPGHRPPDRHALRQLDRRPDAPPPPARCTPVTPSARRPSATSSAWSWCGPLPVALRTSRASPRPSAPMASASRAPRMATSTTGRRPSGCGPTAWWCGRAALAGA